MKLAKEQARLDAQQAGQVEGDDAPRGRGKDSKKKGSSKAAKNNVDSLTLDDFADWLASLYPHQLYVRDVKNDPDMPRTRNILKARQIGMTYYFAGEALEDAVLTGGNQ